MHSMKKILWISIVLFIPGCGGGESGQVTVTPEMETAQKEDEQRVQEAESAMQKQQKALKSQQRQGR